MDSLSSQETHDATINIHSPLRDLRGQVTAYLIAKMEFPEWQDFRHLLLTQVELILGLIAVALTVLAICIYFWVSRPLTAVSRSLKHDNHELLGSLVRQKSEFGNFARLIAESANRKRCLEEEIANRKRTEEALLLKDLIFDNSIAANSVADANGVLTDGNAAFVRMWGYSNKEEFIGRSIGDLLKYPSETAAILASLNSTGSWKGEFTATRKDGSNFVAHCLATALQDDKGRVIGYESSVSDITERKLMEDALRQSEQEFMDVLHASGDAILLIDGDTFVECNEATNQMLGYSDRADFLMTHPSKLSPPNQPDGRSSLEKANEMMQTAVKKGFHRFEWMHRKANGEDFPVEVSLTPVVHLGKTVLHCVWRDITERRRTEEALQESKALMEAIVENVPLMVFLKESTDLRFVVFNRAGEDLLGYDRKDLLGKNNLDLFPPEQALNFMAKDREVLDGEAGMLDIPEEPILTAKKGQRVLHTRKVCIRGADGNTKFLLGISEDITERKRAEDALRESEELSRRIIASSRDCLKVLDLEGNLLSMNEGGQTLLEIDDIAPYLNKSWVDFWKGKDREAALEAISKTIRGEVGSFSAYCETTKGTPKWWEVVITPIRNIDGKIENLLAVSRDITERKHADEERTKLMSVIDSTREAIVVLNAEGTTLYVNHAFEAISGLTANQAVGQYYEALAKELYANNNYGIPWDRMQAGESWTATITYEGRDGGFRLMDQSISPICSSLGEVINYVVFNRDVTEERKLEIRARWADERLRLSIDGMVDGLTLWDVHTAQDDSIQEFICSEANPAALMMLGKERQDAVGCSVRELLKGAEDYDPQELFVLAHKRGQPLIADHFHYLNGNQRMILSVHIWPIGKGVACHLRDVTQRLELETQLRQAQKLEAVGSLAAGIAHEINTPIQFVGDNIRFLADSFTGLMNVLEHHRVCREKMATLIGEQDELRQLRDLDKEVDVDYLKTEIPLAVEQSLEGVRRVSTIVRAMKDFSHINQHEMVPADINQMLETTLTVARNELKYVADVTKDFAPDLPTVECFRNDLNQVFLNMFINAAHAIGDVASAEGQDRGTITIATRRDGDEVVVSISDTGGGIPEGIRDRIFDHFFTTKEVGKGTGQGLSIARSIVVEKHKGAINFDSEIGKGTTFYIHLPISRKEVEHVESQHPVRG